MESERGNLSKPDVEELGSEFKRFVNDRDGYVYNRDRLNYDARFSIWPGQSPDGRKWRANGDGDVWPWKGASDSRPMIVDKYIREDVAFLMTVWKRMRLQVLPTESNDAEWSTRTSSFLKWMKYSQMNEGRREARLLANHMLERGKGLLQICWEKAEQLTYEEVDLEALKTAAGQARQALANPNLPAGLSMPQLEILADLPAIIQDETYDPQVASAIEQFTGDLSPARRLRLIRELRDKGYARFPKPITTLDRPVFTALPLNEEVFLPPEASDLEDASGIFRRELLTETQLRDRIRAMKWDKSFVEEVIKNHKGQVTELLNSVQTRTRSRHQFNLWNNWGTENLFEIIHGWTRRYDADGVPGIYYTCFHGGMKDKAAYHDLLNYHHGQYPFVQFTREQWSRRIDDSRGYGEIANTWQIGVKSQWDSRDDRTSLATVPPSYHPPGFAPSEWGPGVRVPTDNPKEYGFMDIPKWDVGSKEIEDTYRDFADGYFGRAKDPTQAHEATMLRQELADTWLESWGKADTQMLQLCQQFMPDEFYYRVVGSEKGRGIRATREEIQGKFDLVVNYNARDLDPEFVKEKIGIIRDAMAIDRHGSIDVNEALQVGFELTDPNLGERLLKPQQDASAELRRGVREQVAQMALGNAAELVENDPTAGAKMQILQETVQANPKYQQQLQSDENFRQLLEQYVQNLQHSITQMGENVVTGRTGVKPIGVPQT